MAPSRDPQPAFAKDEKVLCFHGELLYEAKILDTKPAEGEEKKARPANFLYRVHYKGWKNTWDDWVTQDRLRAFTTENQELAMNLKKEMDALYQRENPKKTSTTATQGKRRGTANDASMKGSDRGTPAGPRGQKRHRDYELENAEAFHARPSVRIPVPDLLKEVLVDDWEKVTKNMQLVKLPSATPVTAILNAYAADESRKRDPGSAEADILDEVMAGLKVYFNKCLGRLLLYKFERQQYMDVTKQTEKATGALAGQEMSDVYGAEHLCRLFVSLPELIAQTNMDAQSVDRLRRELIDLMHWLSKRIKQYLSIDYEQASHEYIERAKVTVEP